MNTLTILFLFCGVIILFVVAWAWHTLRLRRALFIMRKHVLWSVRHAPREKLVLEVGSGHNPHLRSDVLCDKYLVDDAHRSAGLVADRPLVIADAGSLPFRTGSFDVIISQHMIEHLDDPSSFFKEAGRVARSGLFRAPSATKERLISDPTHQWLIEKQDGILQFIAKNGPIYDPAIQAFVAKELVNGTYRYDNFILDHWQSLEIVYLWNGGPRCALVGEPQGLGFVIGSTTGPTVSRRVTGVERVRSWLRTVLRNVMHALLSLHRNVDLAALLACPACHGDVSVSDTEVYCSACKLRFPVERGIPIMLFDHAIVDTRSDATVSGTT